METQDSKEWIFTGVANLRGPLGELVRPFEPFSATQKFRAKYRHNPRIDRMLVTIPEYHERLKTYTVQQLLSEAKRRNIGTKPINIHDAQWLIAPLKAVDTVRSQLKAKGVSRLADRYKVNAEELVNMVPELAKVTVRRSVINKICKVLKTDEKGLEQILVGNLMAPLIEGEG